MTQDSQRSNTATTNDELNTRRLNRLDALLKQRDQAADRWAEAMAHGTGDHGDSLRELILTERALATLWPATYAERCDTWIERDAAMLHGDRHPHPACRICRHEHPTDPPNEAA